LFRCLLRILRSFLALPPLFDCDDCENLIHKKLFCRRDVVVLLL
jgi:hypothetical protein